MEVAPPPKNTNLEEDDAEVREWVWLSFTQFLSVRYFTQYSTKLEIIFGILLINIPKCSENTAFVQYNCTGVQSWNHWRHCKFKEQNNIFVHLGHGQNNAHECVSIHKWNEFAIMNEDKNVSEKLWVCIMLYRLKLVLGLVVKEREKVLVYRLQWIL
jgi:hypothetical protein